MRAKRRVPLPGLGGVEQGCEGGTTGKVPLNWSHLVLLLTGTGTAAAGCRCVQPLVMVGLCRTVQEAAGSPPGGEGRSLGLVWGTTLPSNRTSHTSRLPLLPGLSRGAVP